MVRHHHSIFSFEKEIKSNHCNTGNIYHLSEHWSQSNPIRTNKHIEMNEERKSPLSFAFDNHRRNYQRRATLQHVIVGKQKQHDKVVLESCLDNIKNRRKTLLLKAPTRLFIESKMKMNQRNSTMYHPHDRYYNDQDMKDNTQSNNVIMNSSSSRTLSDDLNSGSAKQDLLQKLNKAKTRLQIGDGSKNDRNGQYDKKSNTSFHQETSNATPRGSCGSDRIKKKIPNQFLPRTLNSMKNDLIHLHRKQSTKLLPMQINGRVSTLKKNETKNGGIDIGYGKDLVGNDDENFCNKDDSEDEYSSYISNLRKQSTEFNNQNRPFVLTNDHYQRQQHNTSHDDNDDYSTSKNDNTLCYKEVSKPSNRHHKFQAIRTSSQHHHNYQQQQYFAKDYTRLATEYKEMEKYRNNNTQLENTCIICQRKAITKLVDIQRRQEVEATKFAECIGTSRNRSTIGGSKSSNINRNQKRYLIKVLFPCEHRPICNECWDRKKPWTECPVCHEEIKIAIDHTGNEVNEYWDWWP